VTDTTAPSTSRTGHLAYRRDIDGLRAVAVGAVVVYHAFPSVLPGGFIGVDIFFVISGFLISTIIFGGVDGDGFSFATFYSRRIRRIFPALSIVLLACLVAGWFILQPDKYDRLSVHVVGGVGFVSNLVLWSESGYFDSAAELKPLLHLWSLGIEEQFYFVFPMLAVLAKKIRLRRDLLLGGLVVGSFVWCLYLTNDDATAAFYSPISRFWELLIGSVLSVVVSSGRLTAQRWQRPLRWASTFGAALLLVALVSFDGRTPFPGWRALVPVVGAALIIGSGPSSWFNTVVLSRRPLVWVGLISYPLYLWHWPLLALARVRHGGLPSAWERGGLVVAAVVLAYATYRVVERPLRRRSDSRRVIGGLTVAMVAVGVCGIGIATADGVPSRYGAQLADLAGYQYEFLTDARGGNICWLENVAVPDEFDPECVDPDDGSPLTVLWGDSHAARFYPGLRAVEDGVRLAQFTRSSCPPVLDIEFPECRAGNAWVIEQLGRLQPRRVILFAAWTDYPNVDPTAQVAEQLEATIAELTRLGVDEIVVMGPAPRWEDSLPSNMLAYANEQGDETFPSRTFYRFQRNVLAKDEEMVGWLSSSPATYFSVTDAMCDDDGCLTTTNGLVDGLTTWDYGHLTTTGAVYVAEQLVDAIGR